MQKKHLVSLTSTRGNTATIPPFPKCPVHLGESTDGSRARDQDFSSIHRRRSLPSFDGESFLGPSIELNKIKYKINLREGIMLHT